jgi:Fe-S-cluster-containing dehydrogenase component
MSDHDHDMTDGGMTDGSSRGVSRRRFLELMAASSALAGLTACAPPREQIVPYVRPPEQVVPGKPLYFATAHVLSGFADGILVESQLGRPIKVEGNPQHPASLGGTDAFAQASVLTLYEPTRSKVLTFNNDQRTWPGFVSEVRAALDQLRPAGGDGLRILSETVTSPTLAAQIQQLVTSLPGARWHHWEPVNRDNACAGARLAFGQVVDTRYRFDAADIILSLDADPLAFAPGHVRYARDLAARRRPESGALNRIYIVESTPSLLGSMADHRLPLPAAAIESLALALAAALGIDIGGRATLVPDGAQSWLAAVAADLRGSGAHALVLAGDSQPPVVHALAHALNSALGSVGTTLEYTDPVEVATDDSSESLRGLVDDMSAGRVKLLLVLGGNPAYAAPADVPFGAAMQSVALRVHLGLFDDETSALCQWHVPMLHPLETWSDARAYDGTTTIMQPLIAPLYEGKSAHELLAALGDQPDSSGHDIVKGFWTTQQGAAPADFERFWRTALHDGMVSGTALAPVAVSVRSNWLSNAPTSPPAATDGLELVFRPDPVLYDGQFAANAWLLELPRPLTKLTWDNVALLSPATAQRLGVVNQDVVEVRAASGAVRAPAWVLPGQADDSVTVTLGYGRRRGSGTGTNVGLDVYPMRTSGSPWFQAGIELRKTGERYPLASTQGHYALEGRDLVRTVTPTELQRASQSAVPDQSLYPAYPYTGNAWGMVIDQSQCSGCNACIVACQAENNIAVVGKEEVARGREMHWLRLDTYFEGAETNPRILQQLVPCMQCENAPCELVCPVGATTHSDEGLNDMTYNRCVGTRYCSNNCPYKVRHFNFFQYADFETSSLKLLRNPDVTVRSRGVMEKCTYCVQRITRARIQSETEGRAVRDGEVVTACQAACPSGAIIFGNLNDSSSEVAQAKRSSRNYTLLAELNTRPRTTYLATVRNPTQDLA